MLVIDLLKRTCGAHSAAPHGWFSYVLGLIVLCGVAIGCGTGTVERAENAKEPVAVADKALYYHDGNHIIPDADTQAALIQEGVRLYETADNRYLRATTQAAIDAFREDEAIEIVLEPPRTLTLAVTGTQTRVARILIPISQAACGRHALVIVGAPEYTAHDHVLNGEGCSRLRAILAANPDEETRR